jgi:hypothetical protein
MHLNRTVLIRRVVQRKSLPAVPHFLLARLALGGIEPAAGPSVVPRNPR